MNPADQKLKSSILTEIQEHMDEIKRRTYKKDLWKKMFDTINNFSDTEFLSEIIKLFESASQEKLYVRTKLDDKLSRVHYLVLIILTYLLTTHFDIYVQENPSNDTFISMYTEAKTKMEMENPCKKSIFINSHK